MKKLTALMLFVLFILPIQYSSATTIPIVEYLFSEGAGSTAFNSGSLANTDGEIFGASYSLDTPSGTGYSLHFSGDNHFVRVQDTFDYSDKLTIEAWIKPQAVNGQRVIWDDYGNPGVVFAIWDGFVQFNISTEENPGLGIAIYTGTITTGHWFHVAGVYDGVQMSVYINGLLSGDPESTSGTIIDNPGTPTYAAIGSSNVEGWLLNFHGFIDDFRIYNAALTPVQLAGGHFAPVPEPSTMLLLGAGLIGLAGLRRRFGKKITLAFFLTVSTLSFQVSWASPVQWEVSKGGNGHWYEVIYVPTGTTWMDAYDGAEARGGYLATITSEQENDFLWELASDPIYWYAYPGGAYGGPYLGGYQDRNSPSYSEPAGGWRWVTDEPWSYTNWAANIPDNSSMPNNAGREEDYLQFFSWSPPSPLSPTWNDMDATEHPIRSYVIEYAPVPEPATMLLLASGLVGLAGLKTRFTRRKPLGDGRLP